jgi:penicillin V acylase-like amidase (Ntn superfamily)
MISSPFDRGALGQFGSGAEVKAALVTQPVMLEALVMLGGVVSPFHDPVNDATDASFVIEFHKGEMSVYGNPVRAMTPAPRFDRHLTNNFDRSQGLTIAPPESG